MSENNLPVGVTDPEFYEKMAAQAAALAAIEVITWVPTKIDDHVCGRIIDSGTIELDSLRNTGETDIWPTNTIEPIGTVTMDGKEVKTAGKVLRVAWLGPVQLGHYQRTNPVNGNVVAMHYQSDQIPKSGLNPYKLVNCIVFDHTTGEVKRPREVAFGAERPAVGSMSAEAFERAFEADKAANHPLTPREGEKAF